MKRILGSQDPAEWVALNADLSQVAPVNSVAMWYNEIGEMIHVGKTLLVYVPPFEPSELSLYAIRSTKRLRLGFRHVFLGTYQSLRLSKVGSVVCKLLQTSSLDGRTDFWVYTKNRTTQVLQENKYKFEVYAQPRLIWSYAWLPTLTVAKSNKVINMGFLSETIRKWCSDACVDIIERRLPVKSFDHTDNRERDDTVGYYTEINIVLDLTRKPLHLFGDPNNGQLSYMHAQLKNSLDETILRSIGQHFRRTKLTLSVTVATRLLSLCPPGSSTLKPIPLLKYLHWHGTLNSPYKSRPFKLSSAYALTDWPITCVPCPEGHAPRLAYSFDGCHLCPRGSYLGQSNWPSSGGCLPCPPGLSTDRTGATSIDECLLNGGAVVRWGLGYLLKTWLALQQTIVGIPGREIQTRAGESRTNSAWGWLGGLGWKIWIGFGLYLSTTACLIALALYRLHLYWKLRSIYARRFRILLKAAVIGQINLINGIKMRAIERPVPKN
ncbi:unnamed protein product [Calicophoron daubneyi]|uniref:Tyrosine-protein kinase ephrin type A/B receptor-like domain-containing protein n=1 Tax=Calicophoron daubneyi TaxID=300641 RepID=A0AAV2TEW9_CALDB